VLLSRFSAPPESVSGGYSPMTKVSCPEKAFSSSSTSLGNLRASYSGTDSSKLSYLEVGGIVQESQGV